MANCRDNGKYQKVSKHELFYINIAYNHNDNQETEYQDLQKEIHVIKHALFLPFSV